MKIILLSLLISLIGGIVYAAILPKAIKIEDKNLTQIEYNSLKNSLIDKYKTQKYFTPNEWQTYVAVLDWEAKAGNFSKIKVSGNLHKSLMEKIYAK